MDLVRLLLASMGEQILLQKPVEAVIIKSNPPENAGDCSVPRETFADTDTAARVMKRSKRGNESYIQSTEYVLRLSGKCFILQSVFSVSEFCKGLVGSCDAQRFW